jgi:hypothetical protein
MLAKNEEKTATQEAKQIGKAKLLRLVKMKASAKKQASEINGTVGEQIKESVEKDNLRPWAFRTACALEAMSPEKLWHELPALLAYIDDLGLEEKAKKAPPLALEPETAEAEEA